MIINQISSISSQSLMYHLKNFIKDANCYLKLEGLNIAGSIKFRTARFLLDNLEEKYNSRLANRTIIESSSGNLGVALSILCKERSIPFICVTDPNITVENESIMKLYGATVIKVKDKDPNGGYLRRRIDLINALLIDNPNYIWTNQYASSSNSNAHYYETAPQILADVPDVDYLFVGAGTTGTLMGCARYFQEHSPQTRIIAVDVIGSVTFGQPAAPRYIPGLGTSRRPEILEEKYIDDLIMVSEEDTVAMCRSLLQHYNVCVGGSSGSVLSAITAYKKKLKPNSTLVAISPDYGHKYMRTIYNNDWVNEKFYKEYV